MKEFMIKNICTCLQSYQMCAPVNESPGSGVVVVVVVVLGVNVALAEMFDLIIQ